MNRSRFIIFGTLFWLLISTSIASHAVDQSLILVNDGDDFTFILEKYYIYQEISDPTGPYIATQLTIYGNNDFIVLEEGEEFNIKILNATAYDRSKLSENVYFFNPWAIKVEYTVSNGTTMIDELEIGFGSALLAEANWTGFKDEFNLEIKEVSNQFDNEPDIKFNFDLIDSESEFGYKYSVAFNGNSSDPESYSTNLEVRYEKSTGVANYLLADYSQTYIEDNVSYNSEADQIIKRKGYIHQNTTSSIIPGFIFFFTGTALITIIYLRKKYSLV